eukprot:2569866-Rhodomonas_salina.1
MNWLMLRTNELRCHQRSRSKAIEQNSLTSCARCKSWASYAARAGACSIFRNTATNASMLVELVGRFEGNRAGVLRFMLACISPSSRTHFDSTQRR